MRLALTALTDELRRLRTAGVKTLAVSEESIAALRSVISARAKKASASGESSAVRGAVTLVSSDSSFMQRQTAEEAKGYAPPPPKFSPKAPAKAALDALSAPPPVRLPVGDKQARWNALVEIVARDPICLARIRPGKKVVLGVGHLDAKIMLVGEAPGAEEEIQGEPFVGPAGQLLTKMIRAMGLKRTDVYIGNIMNWRPDLPTEPGLSQIGNRPPTEEEMRYCLPYLRAQIEIVNPDIIVALGGTAAQGLLGFGSFRVLGDVRGRWHEFSGKPLMVTYHPSYLLRPPVDNRKKRLVWDDLLKVMDRAMIPISDKQRAFFLDK